jgi:hypothetical protein
MAMTYATIITDMYTVDSPNPGYVVTVGFKVTGTDGPTTASVNGTIQLAVEADKPDYVPYADLTPDIVIGWINEQSGNQTGYYDNINDQIALIENPPQNTPLPWA